MNLWMRKERGKKENACRRNRVGCDGRRHNGSYFLQKFFCFSYIFIGRICILLNFLN